MGGSSVLPFCKPSLSKPCYFYFADKMLMSRNSLKLLSTSFNYFQNILAVVSKLAIPVYPILQVDKVISQQREAQDHIYNNRLPC